MPRSSNTTIKMKLFRSMVLAIVMVYNTFTLKFDENPVKMKFYLTLMNLMKSLSLVVFIISNWWELYNIRIRFQQSDCNLSRMISNYHFFHRLNIIIKKPEIQLWFSFSLLDTQLIKLTFFEMKSNSSSRIVQNCDPTII